MLSSHDIRRGFIRFFADRCGHLEVPSIGVVPDDNTLLFTNSGMVPFKKAFLGAEPAPAPRVVNSQKCIRISGKHNDLEEVGHDTYHHTYFEMLGNWSFGNYGKREAIRWSWQLLTGVWGLDPARLHATVFGGSEEAGLPPDDEAARLWLEETSLPAERIHRFGMRDNFWMMGEYGPCGPCSEIHIDQSPDNNCGALVNAGDPRVMELWNLVFMELERTPNGLAPLPERHIDTGMGLERIAAVLQHKSSNYDTDLFTPIFSALAEITGVTYSGRLDLPADIAARVIADHTRMIVVALADGVVPGHSQQGYEVRRVLRRALRHARQHLAVDGPVLHRLVPTVAAILGSAYPGIAAASSHVADLVLQEEEAFLRTLGRGLVRFGHAAETARAGGGQLDAGAIFELYTTYGFSPDITRQMATEQGLSCDQEGFDRLMTEFRSRSRAGAGADAYVPAGMPATDDEAKWQGTEHTGRVAGWLVEGELQRSGELRPDGMEVGLLLDRTCFYAEAGGQIGDRGLITWNHGTSRGLFRVEDTRRYGGTVIHWGRLVEGALRIGEEVGLHVEAERRRELCRSHSATHLLHAELRHLYGDHVQQRGSRVGAGTFHFDVFHPAGVSARELRRIAASIGQRILANSPVLTRLMPLSEARELPGVRMLFTDAYGDLVRVVNIGDGWSTELCGGTHIQHTGDIGPFEIVSCTSIGKDLVRFSCAVGKAAAARARRRGARLEWVATRLGCTEHELPQRLRSLLDETAELRRRIQRHEIESLRTAADGLLASSTSCAGVTLIVGELPAAPLEQIREEVDRLRSRLGSGVVVAACRDEAKAHVHIGLTRNLAAIGLHAGKLAADIARDLGGSGGGRADWGGGGGDRPERLSSALAAAQRKIEEEVLALTAQPALTESQPGLSSTGSGS